MNFILKIMQEASKRRCNKIKFISLSFVSKPLINLTLSGPTSAKPDFEVRSLCCTVIAVLCGQHQQNLIKLITI